MKTNLDRKRSNKKLKLQWQKNRIALMRNRTKYLKSLSKSNKRRNRKQINSLKFNSCKYWCQKECEAKIIIPNFTPISTINTTKVNMRMITTISQITISDPYSSNKNPQTRRAKMKGSQRDSVLSMGINSVRSMCDLSINCYYVMMFFFFTGYSYSSRRQPLPFLPINLIKD